MGEKGKVCDAALLSLAGLGPTHPRNKVLILFVEVCVKRLVELGRQYRWERPERCPKCGGVRVWGHGFVAAYFDEAGSRVCLSAIAVPRPGGDAAAPGLPEKVERRRWLPVGNDRIAMGRRPPNAIRRVSVLATL
jgi:hypothetical protein